ncbi:MAG: DUF350 domain-containing protein [Candidatus Cloacimonadota bacterium]|nr:MAG: DUF350 domain-containing protein [Candidatus Cloacimonadota bacterium]PIE80663.1 MAG: DUF350 domain-containing protein [Candidatus Delongbacteria bacterium]
MDIMENLLSTEDLYLLNHWQPFLYLALTLIFFWVGKIVYDILTPYKINKELTENDNKAFAVSFSGYLFALGIIVWGVIDSPSISLVTDTIEISFWSVVGIVLLNVNRVINNKFLLRYFDNVKEIIDDKNVGTGAVEFGSYMGTAFIIHSLVTGVSEGWENDLISTAIFFAVGQILFILFSFVYQKFTSFDIHKEIEKDNIAAGVSFGATLLSVGYLISEAIAKSDSLLFLLVWFIGGSILLIITRKITDYLLFPKNSIDKEIEEDANWGVSIIEGTISFIVVLILNSMF